METSVTSIMHSTPAARGYDRGLTFTTLVLLRDESASVLIRRAARPAGPLRRLAVLIQQTMRPENRPLVTADEAEDLRTLAAPLELEIGRASCRERVWVA